MALTAPSAAPAPAPATVRRSRPGAGLGVIGTVCAVVIAMAVIAALFGPLLAPHNPDTVNLAQAYVGPTAGHPLGFDGQGRDLLSRLIVGTRTAMLGPLVVVALSSLVGVALALLAAWRGGWTDTVLTGAMDILFAFPGILLAVLTAAVFGPSLTAASLSLAIAYTPYVMRVIRSEAIRQRAQPYIAALEVQGSRPAPSACGTSCATSPSSSSPRPRSCSAGRCSTSPRSRSSASGCSRPRRTGA